MPNQLSHVRFFDFSQIVGTLIETFLDSIDIWTQDIAGGGLISIGVDGVNVQGGTGAGDHAQLSKDVTYPHWLPSWDKKRSLKIRLFVNHQAGGTDDIFMTTGDHLLNSKGFGFQFKNDGVYGVDGDDTDASSVKLLDKGPGTYEVLATLEAIFYPRKKIVFYIDGVYAGQLTTTLPAGESFECRILDFFVGQGGASPHFIQFSSFSYFQE